MAVQGVQCGLGEGHRLAAVEDGREGCLLPQGHRHVNGISAIPCQRQTRGPVLVGQLECSRLERSRALEGGELARDAQVLEVQDLV